MSTLQSIRLLTLCDLASHISMFFAASVRASNASQSSTLTKPRYSIRTAIAGDHAVPARPANFEVSGLVGVLARYRR
jgi:hypothetical protein